jgi:very-short-patch-repair endonuclease
MLFDTVFWEEANMALVLEWSCPPYLWARLRPIAPEMRRKPTPAEKRLWEELRNRKLRGYRFRRQNAIDRFIVDFYCAEASLVVEVDGEIHQFSVEEDAIRQEYLESRGLQVIRFTNDQVLQQLPTVLTRITGILETPASEHNDAIPT